MYQAYCFALDPSPRAARALASPVGARRLAFNWGLARVAERLEARRRGEDVDGPWTLPALRREGNQAKEVVAPSGRENSKEAYSSGRAGLADALRNWSDIRKGRRAGRRMGFPRFRKKGRGRQVGFDRPAAGVCPAARVEPLLPQQMRSVPDRLVRELAPDFREGSALARARRRFRGIPTTLRVSTTTVP